MSTFDMKNVFEVSVCERIEQPNDVFLVSGGCVVRLRDGRAERLDGLEKQRFMRWIWRDPDHHIASGSERGRPSP